jgi:biopolymer transport protein ExbD
MKLRNYRLERSPKLMIIPMIDIIFFLLVFFMMSTLYMVEQRAVPVSLPQAAASSLNMEKPVIVCITDTGHIYVEQEAMPLELIKKRMQAELARTQQAGVILRADRRVEHGQVVAVLDELKAAGIQRVSVATEGKQR